MEIKYMEIILDFIIQIGKKLNFISFLQDRLLVLLFYYGSNFLENSIIKLLLLLHLRFIQ